MLTTLLVVLMGSFSLDVFANEFWKKDYSRIDSLAKKVKPRNNIEKLTNNLTEYCTSDLEKYRSIFTWVAHNIEYDVEALRKPALRETDPQKIIKRGKAVCAGYSRLFQALCQQANLPCVIVNGWAKDYYTIGKPLGKMDHDWNAIQVDGEWYLCDPTWGAGGTLDNIFTFNFQDFYFCTPPDLFSYDHFPADKQWFLGGKVSEKRFVNYPFFYASAVQMSIRELSPDDGILKFKKGDVIDFKFKSDIPIDRVSIKPSTAKVSEEVKAETKDGYVEFHYEMKTYSPYLHIYLNSKGALRYKMTK